MNYQGKSEGEISIEKNEVFHVFRATDNGWCAGITDSGKSGYVPATCLKPITPIKKRKPSSSPSVFSQDFRKSYRRDGINLRSSTAFHRSVR